MNQSTVHSPSGPQRLLQELSVREYVLSRAKEGPDLRGTLQVKAVHALFLPGRYAQQNVGPRKGRITKVWEGGIYIRQSHNHLEADITKKISDKIRA
jgi:hypothetical protein